MKMYFKTSLALELVSTFPIKKIRQKQKTNKIYYGK